MAQGLGLIMTPAMLYLAVLSRLEQASSSKREPTISHRHDLKKSRYLKKSAAATWIPP